MSYHDPDVRWGCAPIILIALVLWAGLIFGAIEVVR